MAVSNDDDDLALLEIPTPNVAAGNVRDQRGSCPVARSVCSGYPIPDAFEDEQLRTVVSLYAGRIASVRNGTIEVDVPSSRANRAVRFSTRRDGDVIGVAESRFDDERAIGFATPVDVIARFLGTSAAGYFRARLRCGSALNVRTVGRSRRYRSRLVFA